MQMSYLRLHDIPDAGTITANWIGSSVLLLAGDMRDLDSSQASLGSGSGERKKAQVLL